MHYIINVSLNKSVMYFTILNLKHLIDNFIFPLYNLLIISFSAQQTTLNWNKIISFAINLNFSQHN